jgi:HK97 family phage prohead protease
MTKENEIKAKLSTHYGSKSLNLGVKDIDSSTGSVIFYASAFDIKDSDNDIIRKGSFAKSISEIGPSSTGNRKIAHLRNHEWDEQIGLPSKMEEDDFGLLVVSKLGRSDNGKNALLDYEDGILREHSIGFNYVDGKIQWVPEADGGYFNITELKLFEVSGVTFGANEFTPVIAMAKSSGNADPLMKKLNEVCESFQKALKRGLGTDERLESMELRFAQIQQMVKSLEDLKPSIKDTLKAEPTKAEVKSAIDFDYIIKGISKF